MRPGAPGEGLLYTILKMKNLLQGALMFILKITRYCAFNGLPGIELQRKGLMGCGTSSNVAYSVLAFGCPTMSDFNLTDNREVTIQYRL